MALSPKVDMTNKDLIYRHIMIRRYLLVKTSARKDSVIYYNIW